MITGMRKKAAPEIMRRKAVLAMKAAIQAMMGRMRRRMIIQGMMKT